MRFSLHRGESGASSDVGSACEYFVEIISRQSADKVRFSHQHLIPADVCKSWLSLHLKKKKGVWYQILY